MDEAAGIAMGGWVVSSLDDGLARVGLSPEDVDIVIFTHLHPDHVGYAKRFTNARLIVQSAELEATLNEGNPSFDLVKNSILRLYPVTSKLMIMFG
jgi:glyoxylase-like metal-dependent hydrolase (beta-lactamase superfamily II)